MVSHAHIAAQYSKSIQQITFANDVFFYHEMHQCKNIRSIFSNIFTQIVHFCDIEPITASKKHCKTFMKGKRTFFVGKKTNVIHSKLEKHVLISKYFKVKELLIHCIGCRYPLKFLLYYKIICTKNIHKYISEFLNYASFGMNKTKKNEQKLQDSDQFYCINIFRACKKLKFPEKNEKRKKKGKKEKKSLKKDKKKEKKRKSMRKYAKI